MMTRSNVLVDIEFRIEFNRLCYLFSIALKIFHSNLNENLLQISFKIWKNLENWIANL